MKTPRTARMLFTKQFGKQFGKGQRSERVQRAFQHARAEFDKHQEKASNESLLSQHDIVRVLQRVDAKVDAKTNVTAFANDTLAGVLAEWIANGVGLLTGLLAEQRGRFAAAAMVATLVVFIGNSYLNTSLTTNANAMRHTSPSVMQVCCFQPVNLSYGVERLPQWEPRWETNARLAQAVQPETVQTSSSTVQLLNSGQ